MGYMFSRKRNTTAEKLEELSGQISGVEKHIYQLTRRDMYSQRLFSYIAFFLSTCCASVCYTYVPLSGYWLIAYLLIPILLTYVLCLFGKRPISQYYGWRIRRRQAVLDELNAQKKTLLENVRETETYNVAKEILEKYGGLDTQALPPPEPLPAAQKPGKGVSDVFDQSSLNTSLLNRTRTGGSSEELDATVVAEETADCLEETLATSSQPRMRLPRSHRPFYPESKTSVDRFLDYMCGDGVSKRYALICLRCFTHNGMAHADEADNVAYHCYKCGLFNPAKSSRKQSLGVDRLSMNDRSYSEMALNENPPRNERRLSSLKNTVSMSENIDLITRPEKTADDTISEVESPATDSA
ncbi:hypothetical protein L596_004254 [Steinernema carpocapsae]|uniref:Endoplasmic reticulum junction formation protein lunapark n=1 Tax=Steinernema carpocapsae TaxID=34508 RepID=A0A4U8UV56_STECR|nr:hypothetical protein L596_004254 [Steinernema carpocapsae]